MPDLTTTLFSNLNIQTILVGLIVIFILQKVRQRLKYKLPPGPLALPLIGNLEVVRAKFSHEVFTRYKAKYGPVFQVYLGPIRAVVLNDIKVVTEALITQKADFADRPPSPSLMMLTEGGKDIAFANYTPTWKLHRKIAGKALRQYMAGNQLEAVLHKSMTKCLNLMAEQSGPFDPEKYLDLMVFNILDAVVFGESAELDDPEFQLIMKLDKDITELFNDSFVEDMVPLLAKIRKTTRFQQAEEILNKLLEIFGRKFREHEETFDPGNLRDFTDALILARREAAKEENADLMAKLTDTHLVQTLMDIFFAGVDTSKLTMYYAMRYMGSLQAIQSKVQEEIDTSVGKDRYPGLADRKKLQYAEATLHETMRLGMPVPTGLPHMTACDTTVGGYDIPKDTMILINHWALHRDPNYWKDVDTFDPTRYLDESGNLAKKPESWLPFSMGRRVCLGETVAKPELHLIFCCILQRFNITLAPGTNPEMEYGGTSLIMNAASYKIILKERK